MSESPATLSPAAVVPTAPTRIPTSWIAGGAIALIAVAAAAYFAGRHTEPAPLNPPATAAGVSAAERAPLARNAQPAQDSATAAAESVACPSCGVVESVTAVQHKGEGTGMGAVAGGVAGGVIGNQFGKGDGRTALRVLGAIGGAVAGNEVEKRARAVTVYRVKVRTDGGEVRTVEHASAPAVGQRVKLEGTHLKLLSA